MIEIPKGFEKVCRVDSLKDRIGQRFMVNDIDVAVFKVDDEILAVQNHCPHQHAAIMYEGYVQKKKCKVYCPAHGWEFDLKSGNLHGGHKGLDTYETLVIENEVYVKVTEKELNW